MIKDRTSTFIMRVAGDSMAGAGIADGDEIIVDRSRSPRDRSVVVAVVDGDLLIRRLVMDDGVASLATEPSPPAVGLAGSHAEMTIWGVVTRCLHHV